MDRLYAHRAHGSARMALGAVASARTSIRTRRPSRVQLRGDRWVHHVKGTALVTPGYWTLTPDELDARMRDELCFRYEPRPGDVVLDVGAGIGEVTRPLARLVAPGGRVIAVETNPETRRSLKLMLAINGIENVEVVGAAAVERPGTVEISSGADWEANTVIGGAGSGDQTPVPGITLDQVVRDRGLDRIALLKIHIEGAEVAALDGMGECLGRCEHVVVECHDFLADSLGRDEYRTRAKVESLLEERGFEVAIRPNHPEPWGRNMVYGWKLGLADA